MGEILDQFDRLAAVQTLLLNGAAHPHVSRQ